MSVLAFPLLPVVPKRERCEVRLYAIGTSWSRAVTLHSVVALIVYVREIAATSPPIQLGLLPDVP
jgi:hypothetical protein